MCYSLLVGLANTQAYIYIMHMYIYNLNIYTFTPNTIAQK